MELEARETSARNGDQPLLAICHCHALYTYNITSNGGKSFDYRSTGSPGSDRSFSPRKTHYLAARTRNLSRGRWCSGLGVLRQTLGSPGDFTQENVTGTRPNGNPLLRRTVLHINQAANQFWFVYIEWRERINRRSTAAPTRSAHLLFPLDFTATFRRIPRNIVTLERAANTAARTVL